MIIDIHTHTFPDAIAAKAMHKLKHNSHTEPVLDGTALSLSASAKAAGVDLAVIQPVATSPQQVKEINEGAIETNRRTSETRLLSFGCMHPAFEEPEEECARLAEAGIRGVKLHPVYQLTDMDDPSYLRVLRTAADAGLLVLIHAGIDVGFLERTYSDVRKIARALDAVPQGRYILAHMGGWRQWDEAEALFSERSNVWLDTSFSLGDMTPLGDGFYDTHSLSRLSQERFLRMKETFGADRLLFGTDSPWEDQAKEIARIRALGMNEEETAAILGENAARLLGVSL
ncbi:MAG: amidohydrolase family protein [Firmicutes bacterium]|nr:amidohydrolase family protein [Bacillota bacterium]